MRLESRLFLPGNIHCKNSVIRIDFKDDSLPTGDVKPALVRKIVRGLPPQSDEVLAFDGWALLRDTTAPLPVSMVIEILALLLQRSMSWPVTFFGSQSSGGGDRPAPSVIFETRNRVAGVEAGAMAAELCRLLAGSDTRRFASRLSEALVEYGRRIRRVTPRPNSLWMAARAEQRGICWSTIPNTTYLRFGRGRHLEFAQQADTRLTSGIGMFIAREKHVTHEVLSEMGLPVPGQGVARKADKAVRLAGKLGFPVVVKPSNGRGGNSVFLDIANDAQVVEAFHKVRSVSRDVLVESTIPGDLYRITVIGGRLFAAAQRHPPFVTGDGSRSVRKLINRENLNPERQPGHNVSMKPIVLDHDMRVLLAEQRLSLAAVPEAGRIVRLRRAPNPPYGIKTDVTDQVHPSIREICERCASMLGIGVCGIDFVTTDISRPYWETGGAICEVNNMPDLRIHSRVSEGTPRDAAGAVVDMLYPAGRPSSFPIVAILREPGETEVELQLESALSKRGCRVGLVSGQQAAEGETSNGKQRSAHAQRLRALELDRTLDVAIVALSEREMCRSGLGFESVDVVILPRVSRSRFGKPARNALTRLSGKRVLYSDAPGLVERVLADLALPDREAATADRPRPIDAGDMTVNGPIPRPKARGPIAKKPKMQDMKLSWLDRPALRRADEWGRNLEALMIPGFFMSLYQIVEDLACGAREEVKDDCILLHVDDRIKILPFVSDWKQYDEIVRRELDAAGPGFRFGCVPNIRDGGWAKDLKTVYTNREYVYHRESIADLRGTSLKQTRQPMRSLERSGIAVEPIDDNNIDRVLQCNDRWYERKKGVLETYNRRRTVWAFKNASMLRRIGIEQVAAVFDGNVVGYLVAGPLGISRVAYIYGRCDTKPRGVKPYLMREMARRFPDRTWLCDGPVVRNPTLGAFKERFTINASDQQVAQGWVRKRRPDEVRGARA